MENVEFIYASRSGFIVILIVIMAGFTGLRYAYTNIFKNTYHAIALFSFKPMAEQGAGIKLLSTENLLITLLLASSLSFSILIFVQHFNLLENNVLFSSFGLFGSWVLISICVGLLFLIKFIFLMLSGWLFDFPLSQSAHYQEYQSMSHVFNFIFVLALGLGLIAMPKMSDGFIWTMAYVYIAFFLYRQIILLLRLYGKGGYSIYYIFSYLCTTELIPWIVCIGILWDR